MAHSVWKVIAVHTPRVLRRCARCDTRQPFVSSDRFRVNANKQRLDVWLIYRCGSCEQPWNLSVHERVRPSEIGADALDRYHANCRDTAWAVAFDSVRLARLGVDVDFETAYRVERAAGVPDAIRVELVDPCRVRLDRLLASELGVSRAAVRAMAPGLGARELRRPVRHGQELALRGVVRPSV